MSNHPERFFSAIPRASKALALLFLATSPVLAGESTGTLYYTRFTGGGANVKRVDYSYDGEGVFSLSNIQGVATTLGADGIMFAPDGDLIVGGQGDRVHKVHPASGAVTTVNAGGTDAYHVQLDSSRTKAWTSGLPGFLAEVPLYPFSNGIPRPLSGDDLEITDLEFVKGHGYYTASGPLGTGTFGTIDMNTFTTTALLTDLPAAHGLYLDCFTNHLFLVGDEHVTQIDPATNTIVSTLDLSGKGVFPLDQGGPDGLGRIFVASNNGNLLFVDFSTTGLIGDPANFVHVEFLDQYIDDIAPPACLNGPPTGTCPHTQGYWKNHPGSWPVDSLVLGDELYTQDELLTLLKTPPGGHGGADASLILAHQLISAKLGIAAGSDPGPIIQAIQAADALLATLPGKLPYRVNASSEVGKKMTAISRQLDAFNNGRLTEGC